MGRIELAQGDITRETGDAIRIADSLAAAD
jgi:hypothetical protein